MSMLTTILRSSTTHVSHFRKTSKYFLINNGQNFYSSDGSKNDDDDDKSLKKNIADSTSKLRNLLQRPQLHQKPIVGPPIDLKKPIKKISSTSSTTPSSSSSTSSSSSSSSSSDEEPIGKKHALKKYDQFLAKY